MTYWYIYQHSDGLGQPVSPHDTLRDETKFPAAPKWRQFDGKAIPKRPHETHRFESPTKNGWEEKDWQRASTFKASQAEAEMVNAALFLRRPLLIKGRPGTGKSTLAYSIAYQLQLGPVLRWSITSHSTLQDGLYHYDAIGRLHEASLKHYQGDKTPEDIGKYITLGPLGTALLPTDYPRVLLIDELDKSDIDLPNNLLNIFEEGEYQIPELVRLAEPMVKVRPHDWGEKERVVTESQEENEEKLVTITKGRVRCRAFPLIVLTSNAEREFPPAFLRRCLHLKMEYPLPLEKIQQIVQSHFPDASLSDEAIKKVIELFQQRQPNGLVTNDQLLNVLYLLQAKINLENTLPNESLPFRDKIMRNLEDMGG